MQKLRTRWTRIDFLDRPKSITSFIRTNYQNPGKLSMLERVRITEVLLYSLRSLHEPSWTLPEGSTNTSWTFISFAKCSRNFAKFSVHSTVYTRVTPSSLIEKYVRTHSQRWLTLIGRRSTRSHPPDYWTQHEQILPQSLRNPTTTNGETLEIYN